ncbi:calcium-binding mitochondrial carrier protein-like protein Aralar1 [Dothidotthia symphoricarpi CBS 119687]|uniref:Mitochondrial aspartate-glutamate transporter AGC1 n=1 Tax=Dothidotthia symphoricarpi CBS 119687 TaxID=1392245 RepID=A0A6A6ANY6_9PLEO|nr:calcium-binding mitochondrial carrier protein-like protein Aralar1 [Dothidotthia symphoricarpi CBS 119687]KAF2132211.1 calcium-binding mitochondrial carrier protein-like protein Aralar1 [Dothidotthia symphoricarpi CBS 119687]
MASVTEQVGEVLLGTSEEPQLSQLTRTAFMKHAQKDDESDEYYLNEDQFIDAVAPESEDYHKIKRYQYGILFMVADRDRKGKVSIHDWSVFQNLLAKPDAEYEVIFRFFDKNRSGYIDFNDFYDTWKAHKTDDSLPFNWEGEWATLYVGSKKNRHSMTYPQFAQMLRGLQGERVRQAFLHFDNNKDGFIEPENFQRIIQDTASHKLSDYLLENLPTLCNISVGSKISYANVRAFQNMIQQMDMVELIVRNATGKSTDGKITRTDFLNEAARLSRFNLYTPMEADILFHFAGLDDPSGRLGLRDFARVLDPSWHSVYVTGSGAIGDAGQKAFAKTKTIWHDVLESVHHFALGSLAGAFGAFMVYPIDLVKTRMQNQRSSGAGHVLYKNSLDCAKKVIKNEGFRGLYSGVLPQLVGVAPEKAIKLTVNDLVRGKLTDKDTGSIKLAHELLAGGSAGACQVIFTNPLEIVKIRLQIQGELSKNVEGVPKRSAMWIVRNLGLVGLYKGVTACLLRDVPFSAIYFPTYSHLKKDYFGESPQKSLGVLQMLTAGAIAGMPAAYLTTPCDVIKTRLQVEARKGEATYNGLRHCAQTIFRDEGFKAFFKGGPARIMRSSPQFGFTLAGYEVLQRSFPMPGSAVEASLEPSVGLSEASAPLPYLRSRNALKVILDLDENFGRPKLPAGQKFMGIPGFGGKSQS